MSPLGKRKRYNRRTSNMSKSSKTSLPGSTTTTEPKDKDLEHNTPNPKRKELRRYYTMAVLFSQHTAESVRRSTSRMVTRAINYRPSCVSAPDPET